MSCDSIFGSSVIWNHSLSIHFGWHFERWSLVMCVRVRSACVQSQQHLFKKLFATLDDTEIGKCFRRAF